MLYIVHFTLDTIHGKLFCAQYSIHSTALSAMSTLNSKLDKTPNLQLKTHTAVHFTLDRIHGAVYCTLYT